MALRAMFEAADATDTAEVAAFADGVSWSGPRGEMTLSGGYTSSDIYLAAANGGSFDIVSRFEDVAPGNACTDG